MSYVILNNNTFKFLLFYIMIKFKLSYNKIYILNIYIIIKNINILKILLKVSIFISIFFIYIYMNLLLLLLLLFSIIIGKYIITNKYEYCRGINKQLFKMLI